MFFSIFVKFITTQTGDFLSVGYGGEAPGISRGVLQNERILL